MKKSENRLIKSIKSAAAVFCLAAAVISFLTGIVKLTAAKESYTFLKSDTFYRVSEALEEEYEDETVCPVEFATADEEYTLIYNYTYEEWEALPSDVEIEGYIYVSDSGEYLTFSSEPSEKDIKKAERNKNADVYQMYFSIGMAMLLAGIGIGVITVFGKFFTAYEQIWFVSILVLAAVFSIIFPEESSNGVNGLIIMALYLLDTFLNILCELLISKQSKWNFIVSVFVELTEIAICIVLMYRFATLASTLFFWLPCDIISFINWHKHPDKKEEELTVVRTLKGWQEVVIIASIFVWTVGVGYFLTTLDLGGDFFKSRTIEVIVCYMDACVSAVGIVNGVFILLRLREQWIAWYIDAILEGIINILSGQYVLLILKLGYLTNTTYGYVKWTKYIKGEKKSD